jgi:hypothetical protein
MEAPNEALRGQERPSEALRGKAESCQAQFIQTTLEVIKEDIFEAK